MSVELLEPGRIDLVWGGDGKKKIDALPGKAYVVSSASDWPVKKVQSEERDNQAESFHWLCKWLTDALKVGAVQVGRTLRLS
jgi:hypothetical protein